MLAKNGKWNKKYIFAAYDYAKEGVSEEAMSKAFGIHYQTLRSWITKKPMFALAIQKGREYFRDGKYGTQTFVDYVYKQLPLDKKKVWDEVLRLEKEKNGREKAHAMLKRTGLRVRQYLFIHSWVSSNFNIAAAMRKIGICRGVFNQWLEKDDVFCTMVEDIKFYQKEFFKNSLFTLAKCGDTAAVLYGNRVYNRDDGFDERASINVNIDNSSTQIINQNIVNISELHLPLETERELLTAIEEKERQDAIIESA